MNTVRHALIALSFLVSIGAGGVAQANSDTAKTETTPLGQYDTYAAFPAKRVAPRSVTVFIPSGPVPADGYSVLYMHDGRNVFDPKTAMGGEPWAADRAVVDGHYPLIVVAIDNTPLRWSEYVPMNAYTTLPSDLAAAARGQEAAPISNEYVDFIALELKPFIDAHYRTRTDARHTFVAGSSMGGLISIFALERRPDVFSRAAGLSTHWPATVQFALFGKGPESADPRLVQIANHTADRLAMGLPDPSTHRLWVDYGTETLDVFYAPYALRFQKLATELGFGDSLVVKEFPGTAHNEASWRKRLPEILSFFMN